MRCLPILLLALAAAAIPALAQRHSGITSPPTAPPPPQQTPPPPEPIVAVSSGLGPLQFTTANSPVPAPDVLAYQLRSTDEHLRAAALSSIGAPPAYITHGNSLPPHSILVDSVALGEADKLDAILTVELELHLVSAILVPSPDGTWRRVATVTYATPFADPDTNPGTFLRTARSLNERDHYVAVFHGISTTPDGDITENEAHLRIVNDRAVITISFVSREQTCETAHLQPHTPHADCELTERWLQDQAVEGPGHVVLVTATGRIGAHDAIDPISRSRAFDFAVGRSFECQPFVFSDEASHYQPTANSAACFEPKTPTPAATPKTPAATQPHGPSPHP
jgi:hypothetical protein